MLNEVYEKIEVVLHKLDVGGEQSRAFADEIGLLRKALGYPEPVRDEWDELERRRILTEKLWRLGVESKGILIQLPAYPIARWLDGSYQDDAKGLCLEEVHLAELLGFITETGVNPEV